VITAIVAATPLQVAIVAVRLPQVAIVGGPAVEANYGCAVIMLNAIRPAAGSPRQSGKVKAAAIISPRRGQIPRSRGCRVSG
jgi:hypothetical protein